MAKCANCGTELEEGQKFCFECGTPVPQTKKCIKCGIELPLKMKFCPECGANQNGTTAAGGDGSFNLGDKNVIGGDVIGHKEETHVAGNATFIKNEDQTKQVKKCHICGSLVSIVQGFDCPECHQFTCENCYNVNDNLCNECVEQKKEGKLNRYKDALRMVLADGRIEASERRELINLQQQLGISNEIAKQLEDELKSPSTSDEFTTFEKLNFDKTEDLFYKQGNVDEALKLIEPIVTAHPDDEKVLSLYLPILTEKNPEKALQKIDNLQYDILMAFITKVSIYLKKKNLNEAEISLNQTIRIWHDNTLVKCYQVLLNYAFYKQSEDFSFMEKACNIASNLGNAENPLELSYQVKVQSILQAEVGEQEVDFDEDFCEQNGLLFWIMINNPIYTMEENKKINLQKQEEKRKKEEEARRIEEAEIQRKKNEELKKKYKEEQRRIEQERLLQKEKNEKERIERLQNLQEKILQNESNFSLDDLLEVEDEFHNAQIQFYISGRFIEEQDFENSLYYAKESSAQQNIEGINREGWHYLWGKGCEKDLERAYNLFTQAANQNLDRAIYNLGVMYEKGSYVAQSYEEAIKYYKKASEQNYSDAQNKIGWFYETGKGVSQDYEEAVKWYKLAADNGNINSIGSLGNLYHGGKGIAQDYNQAFKYFKLGADKNDMLCQSNVGLCYQFGHGVEKNETEAIKFYTLAAEKNNIWSQKKLGKIYKEKSEENEAAKWYKMAADAGDVESQFILGSHLNGLLPFSEAFPYLKKAALNGYADAQFEIGRDYLWGCGNNQNIDQGVKWIQRASDNGHVEAQNILGILLHEGIGLPKDKHKGLELMNAAREKQPFLLFDIKSVTTRIKEGKANKNLCRNESERIAYEIDLKYCPEWYTNLI